ncbi:MAG: hypothetical protein ACI8PD_001069 [Nitrospinales bacterium]|jgi:hypothetical protein
MIDAKQLPVFVKEVGLLENQLAMFETKVKDASEIEPGEKGPEEERTRILKIIHNQKKKLSKIPDKVETTLCKNKNKKIDLSIALESLQMLDEHFRELKTDIETIVENQYECKLEAYKQEIFKSVDLILDPIDFIIPNIRYELAYMEKHYRKPDNMANTILPEVHELVGKLEDKEIGLKEFFDGNGSGDDRVLGYRELRAKNKVFSRYQYYENSPESYKDLNDIYYEICKTMEGFLKDKRSEPELRKFYSQVKERGQLISKMSEIFDTGSFLTILSQKSKKKYSYCEEVRKATTLLEQFNKLRKNLIFYNDAELKRTKKALETKLSKSYDRKRLNVILDEVDRFIEEGRLPFVRLEMIFNKLIKNDFNIVVLEKDADDITITPYHEKRYGRDILARINIIIHEVDFWYPPDEKQLLFQNISKATEKIQADEPLDKNEFKTMMQTYDQAMEKNIRKMYPDKVKELADTYSAFKELFSSKIEKEKLEKKLGNKNIWKEIQDDLEVIGKNISVLSSDNAALRKNVNKFSFLKKGTEGMSQVLYDLSMQLFILFEGLDARSITSMTNILSTYNEFNDLASLWASFSHYFKKNNIASLSVNEQAMCQLARDPRCQDKLKAIFERDD